MMHVRNMQSSHKHTYPSPEITIVFKRVKQAEKGSEGGGQFRCLESLGQEEE